MPQADAAEARLETAAAPSTRPVRGFSAGSAARLELAFAGALLVYFVAAVLAGHHYKGAPPPPVWPAPSPTPTVWPLAVLQNGYPNSNVENSPSPTGPTWIRPASADEYGAGAWAITYPKKGWTYVFSALVRGNRAAYGKSIALVVHERAPGRIVASTDASLRLTRSWKRLEVRWVARHTRDTFDAFIVRPSQVTVREAIGVREWRLVRVTGKRRAS